MHFQNAFVKSKKARGHVFLRVLWWGAGSKRFVLPAIYGVFDAESMPLLCRLHERLLQEEDLSGIEQVAP